MANTTPTVRCPRSECGHPIDFHHADAECDARCGCRVTPNTIAVALLFGDLTPPAGTQPTRISRQADGSWA